MHHCGATTPPFVWMHRITTSTKWVIPNQLYASHILCTVCPHSSALNHDSKDIPENLWKCLFLPPGQQTALGLLCKSAGNVKEFTLFYRLNGSQDIFIYFWMGGRPISREESSEFLLKKLWIFSQATPVSQVHSKHHLGQSLTAQELWICHYQLTLEIIFRCDSISL